MAAGGAREAVKVVVRCRPMNSQEKKDKRKSVVHVDTDAAQIALHNPKEGGNPKTFTFDSVYADDSTQKEVYEETGYPLVESALGGFNATMFAYGQTGCGKTFTMQGKTSVPELRGVIPNSFEHLWEEITAAPDKEFLVRIQYLELYNEELRDLLVDNKHAKEQKLDIKEDKDKGIYVKGLCGKDADGAEEMDRLMTIGNERRTVGATKMNAESSRSHSIFTVIIEQSEERADGSEHIMRGKLNMVDLAGSERVAKTGAAGTRMQEGIKINLSLTALGNVISALVDPKKHKHIPYRDSKLTRLLQDSLGGNTKTVMMAAVGPADYNYDETLSTLRYANRAKKIKNKPVINEDPKDALIRQYKDEITKLKEMLHKFMAGEPVDIALPAAGAPAAEAPAPAKAGKATKKPAASKPAAAAAGAGGDESGGEGGDGEPDEPAAGGDEGAQAVSGGAEAGEASGDAGVDAGEAAAAGGEAGEEAEVADKPASRGAEGEEEGEAEVADNDDAEPAEGSPDAGAQEGAAEDAASTDKAATPADGAELAGGEVAHAAAGGDGGAAAAAAHAAAAEQRARAEMLAKQLDELQKKLHAGRRRKSKRAGGAPAGKADEAELDGPPAATGGGGGGGGGGDGVALEGKGPEEEEEYGDDFEEDEEAVAEAKRRAAKRKARYKARLQKKLEAKLRREKEANDEERRALAAEMESIQGQKAAASSAVEAMQKKLKSQRILQRQIGELEEELQQQPFGNGTVARASRVA